MTGDSQSERVDLAKEADFQLGESLVRPSTRQIEVNGSPETLEPRIMQVLVVLARKRGQVISRDELIETCWEGRVVGDDALQRCISKVRKLGEAAGDFRVETITRVGYRLHAPDQVETPAAPASNASAAGPASEPATGPAKAPAGIFPIPRKILLSAVIALAAIVAVLASWGLWGRGRPALEPSIAVMQFQNLTGDPEKDYFARSIASEIIENLSQLNGLKVIARNSSFTFKGDTAETKVGEELHVANVLSGTVSEEGGRIRISANLVDVRTGQAIWARPFERDLAPEDPYAVQRLIAEQVSGAMSIAFDVNARARLAGSGTHSLEAYDFYLQGLDQWWYQGDSARAEQAFARAIELDPNYADAWAGRAITTASRWGVLPPDEARAQTAVAYTMAKRAVELDPDLSFAQAIFGAVSTTQKKWGDAETATRRALEISPTNMALNNREMLLLRTGRIADAYSVLLELREADPLRGPDDLALAGVLSAMGRHAELGEIIAARRWLETGSLKQLHFVLMARINASALPEQVRQALEAISQRPEKAPAEFAAAVLAVFDKPEKARAVLKSWYEDKSFDHYAKWDLIPILAAWYGDTDLVLRVWQDELPTNTPRTAYIWSPAFAPARARPEFKTIVKDIGFVDFWRAQGWADKCRARGEADFECS
ncbi:MAG TPA: winged helix-turn-helix domain-containing protein [Hyphomonadaceae bacterium]|jgi:TolB-like protein/DNA-binding winged helix-turn-helix (wHTH) protein|nr:winged helix-turn-helix domain-containing protein [Hyphomonadaceae bacterium]